MECKIIEKEEEFDSLAPAWDELQARVGLNPFSDYGSFKVWWVTIARARGVVPHIVAGWRDGRLVALLPLVVVRKRGFRILYWAGYDVYCGPVDLYEDQEELKELWALVRKSPGYDVAVVKYVEPGSPLQKRMEAIPCAKIIDSDNLFTSLLFNGRNGEAWFKSQKKAHRSHMRTKKKLLSEKAPLLFTVYDKNIPEKLIEELLVRKREWCLQNGYKSLNLEDNGYLAGLIGHAQKKGIARMFCLTLGDRTIGQIIGFTSGKTLLAYMLSHDPEFIWYSPGTLTIFDSIMWAADNGFEEFSFMEGREPYKARYYNNQKSMLTYAFCRSAWGLVGLGFLLVVHNKYVLGAVNSFFALRNGLRRNAGEA